MSMESHWSVRDTILVHESRRVPCFREFCRPSLLCNGVVLSHWVHVRLFSIEFFLAAPTDTNYSRILFANFATMQFHRIRGQRLQSLEVWLAQFQWSSVF